MKINKKERLRHLGHFSKLCLRQQLFTHKDFCLKTRFCNNLITANAMALTKVILESLYRVLPRTLRATNLKGPVHFHGPLNFSLV